MAGFHQALLEAFETLTDYDFEAWFDECGHVGVNVKTAVISFLHRSPEIVVVAECRRCREKRSQPIARRPVASRLDYPAFFIHDLHQPLALTPLPGKMAQGPHSAPSSPVYN